MADERRRGRTPGPRSRTGPGRSRTPGRGTPARRPSASRSAAARPRPRLTGRAAILVLVLAVLTVSYASSLRAYLTQREHLQDLSAEIDDKRVAIQELEREKRRWEDPAFVEAQARLRLDYVMPGETAYVAIDEDGPLDGGGDLSEPVEGAEDEVPDAWWDTTWDSVIAAGDPEGAAVAEQEQQPADEIEAPPSEEDE